MNLYHYTDVNAVASIINSHKLWLTDLRFMNDSTELQHGIKWIKEALSQQPYGLFHDSSYGDAAASFLTEFIDHHAEHSANDPIFSMSFSRVDDLLSQWRAYGSYSISFNQDRLSECGIDLRRCIYRDKDKSIHAESAASTAVSTVSHDMAENSGIAGYKSIDAAANLLNLAAIFKHSGFEEEAEVRMTTKLDPGEVKYRSKQGILAPYIEIPIAPECIIGVCVGPIPNQELATTSMRMLATQIERRHAQREPPSRVTLGVSHSATPYRP